MGDKEGLLIEALDVREEEVGDFTCHPRETKAVCSLQYLKESVTSITLNFAFAD